MRFYGQRLPNSHCTMHISHWVCLDRTPIHVPFHIWQSCDSSSCSRTLSVDSNSCIWQTLISFYWCTAASGSIYRTTTTSIRTKGNFAKLIQPSLVSLKNRKIVLNTEKKKSAYLRLQIESPSISQHSAQTHRAVNSSPTTTTKTTDRA